MMRIVWIILLLVLWVRAVHSQTLIAHYPFDKGSAADISSNKNNGIIIGGVTSTADRFGNPCGALVFNGLDGFIEIANTPSLQSIQSAFTIVCWFKLTNRQTLDKWLTIVCKGNEAVESDMNPQFRMQTFQSAGQSTVSINTDFTEYDNDFQSHPFEYDKWAQYVLVYNGASVTTWLNGNKIWEFAYSRPMSPNSAPLYIGRDIPGNDEYYAGCMDDLRIYSDALPEDRIRQLYNEQRNLVAFDEFTLSALRNITVNTEKGKCYAVVNFAPPVLDIHCGTAALKQISGLPSGSQFPRGSSAIVYEATGSSGSKKTAYAKVIVVDKEPPVISCSKDTTLFITGVNSSGLVYSFRMPQVTDNCGTATVSQQSGLPSGVVFPEGKHELEFVAVDGSGNTSQPCRYKVTVLRNIPPVKLPKDTAPPITIVKPGKVPVDSLKQPPLIPAPTPAPIPAPMPKPALPAGPEKIDSVIRHAFDFVSRKPAVTLVIYDHAIEDGDTISVFLDGKVLVDHQMIRMKGKGSIIKSLQITAGKEHLLVVKAWNNGSIKPNTMTIEFHEGDLSGRYAELRTLDPVLKQKVNAERGIAASISLKYKEK